MRIICIFSVVVAAAAVAAGCGSDSKPASKSGDDSVKVLAATYPLAWAAEQVGGDNVEVSTLTPPGVEPHDLELTPKDVAAIDDADLVLYVGDGFQPAVEEAIEQNKARAIDVLTLDGMNLLEATEKDSHADEEEHTDEEKEHAEGEHDPHVWLDPTRLAIIAEAAADKLDGDASDVTTKLTDLDDRFKDSLSSCKRREIFTSHAAFAYLADRYDLSQVAIAGISPEAEPSPAQLKEVANLAEEKGATTIFFETLVSPKLSETVAREIGAKTATLDPLEGLSQERLDAGDDYIDVMNENREALVAGLDCKQ
jgi:zinc transport system substrate-binding protein